MEVGCYDFGQLRKVKHLVFPAKTSVVTGSFFFFHSQLADIYGEDAVRETRKKFDVDLKTQPYGSVSTPAIETLPVSLVLHTFSRDFSGSKLTVIYRKYHMTLHLPPLL